MPDETTPNDAELERRKQKWAEADHKAGEVSALLRAQGIGATDVMAMALMLIAADDVVDHDAADEETFAMIARIAYRLRADAHKQRAS